PFCLVMLTDSVNGKKNDGQAKEHVTVVDVAQLLLESVKTPEPPVVEPEPAEEAVEPVAEAPAAEAAKPAAEAEAPAEPGTDTETK
ncbi:hypothetical protein, partial [Streptomyces sp. NPDC056883]|uniref:hypothetical protein n=1 Tax=Streptomyces sp. NPDC056883 TaxID=3345959 RepID=UPI0036A13CE1